MMENPVPKGSRGQCIGQQDENWKHEGLAGSRPHFPYQHAVAATDANLLLDAYQAVFMPEAAGQVAVLAYEASQQ